ncbi:MAG TPA: hypothetical protein VN724_19375 [Pyrinomonadaceae bacterium]|jgi:hypothetical protein|nr:hypothetical protein [Pyrinomonadaceae bacterium]
MKTFLLVLGCAAVLLFQPAGAKPQTPQEPVKHGGKIEVKYDGFNYETVMRLQKMKVNCDGLKDKFAKDACVSIEVTLHCPGTQVNYVRHVTIQVVFENKDWVHFHPPDQRELIVATDSETLRLGRMNPVTTSHPGTWDTKVEVLEAKIPYEAFKKMALSQSVGIQVGSDAVELRDKNRAALKDLNSRVIGPATNASAAN